jgi:hypothetical protein
MGASFIWPRTPDPMRRIGVGIFFGMCGTFFQSITEWVFHQTPIYFTFNILLGVLASLYALKKAERKDRRENDRDMAIDDYQREHMEEAAEDPAPDRDDPFVIRRSSFQFS